MKKAIRGIHIQFQIVEVSEIYKYIQWKMSKSKFLKKKTYVHGAELSCWAIE